MNTVLDSGLFVIFGLWTTARMMLSANKPTILDNRSAAIPVGDRKMVILIVPLLNQLAADGTFPLETPANLPLLILIKSALGVQSDSHLTVHALPPKPVMLGDFGA